jgi:uncharacterized protein (DUF697 family)
LAAPDSRGTLAQRASDAVYSVVTRVPTPRRGRSATPQDAARGVASEAAAKAALAAGSFALPPGPLGWLTLVPDLIVIWRIQAQMVADIGGCYGKSGLLGREQMLYCLFRHTAAQAVRDLVVRAGGRMLIQSATSGTVQAIARKIGMNVAKKTAAKAISRWVPIIGAVGVGAYAYYDTAQVAKTAMEFFEKGVEEA